MLMLVQGIRFLNGYKVYHLDLKPQNIMTTKSMMVKIIDFGESYHHEVCEADFVPGFTMPYSSPEIYYPIDSGCFSEKNDIFSMGVIAYEMFNQRLPFYFYDPEKHFDRYTEENFEDYWFLAAEDCDDRGDPYVFSLLQLVIGRCLDIRPSKRPDLDWMCLIMREFLDFYHY